MRFLPRLALATVAVLASAPLLSAQSFTYSTGGCFTTGSACSATESQIVLERAYGLFFSGVSNVTVGPVTDNGYIALSDLGSFTFLSLINFAPPYVNDGANRIPFTLWITFTSPTIDAPVTALIDFDRSLDVVLGPGLSGAVSAPVYRNAQFLLSGTPYFLVAPDPITPQFDDNFNVVKSNRQRITGALDCSPIDEGDGPFPSEFEGGLGRCTLPTTTAPEPGTWALMTAGLAGLGLFARRRRR
jgi:hypothetical protein